MFEQRKLLILMKIQKNVYIFLRKRNLHNNNMRGNLKLEQIERGLRFIVKFKLD